ncbi:twin-arginine translocation pathway signal protein [Pseudomonas sp. 148P]|uniref:Twin-arginine translocation pathway signal protein n=1 Tax=Pseudomonas ulcerans TaxID=3115852 RepID=A0ABU7HMI1_9PSED|nr:MULTISPECIES: twin-arginine translocation pathway signal protein [unclassified Pseudomonas]MEE1921703.1 twin-arginine translocation pathway signal protein [Pseudomonas sp. 147P]MEE1932738.1 twin-arginine translocation pathway signal protein [Pseudomonas sp. 148P]
MNRRGLLKFSLGATLFLGGASLVGCSATTPANGFRILRDDDLPMLRAVIPVVLEGTHSLLDQVLIRLDETLASLSPEMLKLTWQLFDVLALPLTRGPLTGVWGAWEQAEPARIQAFLLRWRDSSLNLLRQGYCSLLQLLLMAWYSLPESWGACGYPGPPKI